MFRLAMLGGFMVASLAYVAAQTEDARRPIPAKESTAKSEKTVKDLFKADYQRTKPTERSAFAKKLLEVAGGSAGDEAAEYVLLREARDMAGKAGDLTVFREAAKKLAASYRISESEAIAGGIDFLTAGVVIAPSAEIAQALLELVDDSVRNADFATAQSLQKAADAVAKKTPSALAAVQARAKSLPLLRKEFDKLPEARKTLESDPADKKANLLVGRFLCFVKNDWDEGLPRLLLGADAALRVAVDKDIAATGGTATARVEAADQWKKLAGTSDAIQKAALESRALHWYTSAADELTGYPNARVDKLIQELTGIEPKWRALTAQLNDSKYWQTIGNWTETDKKWTGEGAGYRQFQGNIPYNVTLQFDMMIKKGDRTFIVVAKEPGKDLWLGCEGENLLKIHGFSTTTPKGQYLCKQGELMKVKIELKNDRIAASVNDAVFAGDRTAKSATLKLRIDNAGAATYWNFRASPVSK